MAIERPTLREHLGSDCNFLIEIMVAPPKYLESLPIWGEEMIIWQTFFKKQRPVDMELA